MKIIVWDNEATLVPMYDILTFEEALVAIDIAIDNKLNSITIDDFISETSFNKETPEYNQ